MNEVDSVAEGQEGVSTLLNNAALLSAAMYGDAHGVRTILGRGNVDINAVDANGTTALIGAAYNGQTEVVETLLEYRSSTKACVHNGNMATALATREILPLRYNDDKLCLNLNHQNMMSHNTALLCAVWNGHTAVVQALVNCKGTNVNVRRRDSSTPLFLAAEYGNTDIVKILLSRDDINPNARCLGNTPLTIAIRRAYPEAAHALIDHATTDVNEVDMRGLRPLEIVLDMKRNPSKWPPVYRSDRYVRVKEWAPGLVLALRHRGAKPPPSPFFTAREQYFYYVNRDFERRFTYLY